MVKDAAIRSFQDVVWQHFQLHGRHDLPWRIPEPDGSFDPYKILVSEIMLQQTQVPRVIPKYAEFLDKFPTVDLLAKAPLSEVLVAWSGLGYNRRAKFLWQAAQQIVQSHDGTFPSASKAVKLPGVGKNTAGAIQVYAFNQPMVFVETNIRTVFIYHFFENADSVADAEILELVMRSLPKFPKSQAPDARYRTWYWALMDYGSFLKQSIGNLNRLSKSYAKQSPFEGSRRQIRGKVIRLLSTKPMSEAELNRSIGDERLRAVLDDLLRETMIVKRSGMYTLR